MSNECTRQVVWHGEVERITVKQHSYAWSGRIPCTGSYRCVYCGAPHPDAARRRTERLKSFGENPDG